MQINQWDVNGGKCGICGDPWQGPRLFEFPDGDMVEDHHVVTQTYLENEVIEVQIQITQNHKGWFEFRLCDVGTSGGIEANQKCLDQHLLADDNGQTRFTSPPEQSGFFYFYLVLPPGLTCSLCVLQWKWKCGNNWGCDATGCGVGKGEYQEEFYACSDVTIEPRSGPKPIITNTSPKPVPTNKPYPQPVPTNTASTHKPYPMPNLSPNPLGTDGDDPSPGKPVIMPTPSANQVDGHQPLIPGGYNTYGEYLQAMFASSANDDLKYQNKRPSAPAQPHGTSSEEWAKLNDQFLHNVIGFSASPVQGNDYTGGMPRGGLPSWATSGPSNDKDAVDRLCAACHINCRFSECLIYCPDSCDQ